MLGHHSFDLPGSLPAPTEDHVWPCHHLRNSIYTGDWDLSRRGFRASWSATPDLDNPHSGIATPFLGYLCLSTFHVPADADFVIVTHFPFIISLFPCKYLPTSTTQGAANSPNRQSFLPWFHFFFAQPYPHIPLPLWKSEAQIPNQTASTGVHRRSRASPSLPFSLLLPRVHVCNEGKRGELPRPLSPSPFFPPLPGISSGRAQIFLPCPPSTDLSTIMPFDLALLSFV